MAVAAHWVVITIFYSLGVIPWRGFLCTQQEVIHRLEMCKGGRETFQQFWGDIDHSRERGEQSDIKYYSFPSDYKGAYLKVSDSSQLSKNILYKQCCALCNSRGAGIRYQHQQGKLHFLQYLSGLPLSYMLLLCPLTLRLRKKPRTELQALLWLLKVYCYHLCPSVSP